MSDEEQRLLSSIWDEEVDDSNEPNSISKRATALPIGLKIYIIILHILLVVVTCLAVTMSVHHRPTWKVSTIPELRSIKRVGWTEHMENAGQNGLYAGAPSETNAEAWELLLQRAYFNATAAELVSSEVPLENAVKVSGGGYLAALGVYHEMHCINKLRYFIYSQPNITHWDTKELTNWVEHLDHCIEMIRLSLTCSADMRLYTFFWPDNSTGGSRGSYADMTRDCVDWRELETWSNRRSLPKGMGVEMPG